MKHTDLIVDGFFYSFHYVAKSTAPDVDQEPLIFCIRPSQMSLNNFVGLNLHHLPVELREKLIIGMHKMKQLISYPRVTFTEEELNSIVPGCKAFVREYNRKRVFDPVRIENREIINYIYSDGRLREDKPSKTVIDFLLKYK